MNSIDKLKPAVGLRIIIICVLFIAVFITGFAIIQTLLTETDANKVSGIIYLVITLTLVIGFLKSKHSVLIPVTFLNMSIALSFLVNMEKAMIIPNVLLLVITAYIFYFDFRHNIMKRKILELAARPIDDTQNGFTDRPYPAGKITCSKGELHGFAHLMRKLLITVPVMEENGISFSLPDDWFKRLYNTFGHYTHESRISIQYSGEVSVHITSTDYKKYKNALTFDRLCDSMGALFIGYFEQFREGEGDLIKDQLKTNHTI
ncbi:MAG: hypothetical protein HN936_15290 [Bacteroidetes bacterium]|nr:hypothetical protein [Bacteroidota bacterium]